ncbi:MAG: hypothetical protein V7603_5056 [Micromonosporaceae bacterium]
MSTPTPITASPVDVLAAAYARERAIAAQAAERAFALAAGRAARLVAAALPEAATLIFGYQHDHDWFDAELEAVRGPAGQLLWCGDGLADSAEATALHAAGGPASTDFDERICAALGELIGEPADLDRPLFRRCTTEGTDPGDGPAPMVGLDVAAAVAAAEHAAAPDIVTFEQLGELLTRATAVLDPDDVPGLLDALRGAVGAAGQTTRQQRVIDELRILLRAWRQYDDAALIGLTERLLQHYGFWGDDDHDAASQRHDRYSEGVDENDRAYDGWSNEPQKRTLSGRERDILCRILWDVIAAQEAGGDRLGHLQRAVRFDPSEIAQLREMRFVLDPRND